MRSSAQGPPRPMARDRLSSSGRRAGWGGTFASATCPGRVEGHRSSVLDEHESHAVRSLPWTLAPCRSVREGDRGLYHSLKTCVLLTRGGGANQIV